MQHIHHTSLYNVLASSKLFWGLLVIFIFQAGWIALSGYYPMAFDEQFHFGIIQIYAQHLSPFLNEHPPQADVFGAVTRDPSYLYHYIMSFPLRFLQWLTDSQTVQILVLRFLNIACFAAGLVIFRKVLQASGATRAFTNVLMICFVLVPVVPLLAAQINYDNVLFLLTGSVLLLTIRWLRDCKQSRFNVSLFAAIIIVCMLASLVQYKFLPIGIGVVLFIGWHAYRTWGFNKKLWQAFKKDWHQLSRLSVSILIVASVVSAGLFVQRYGVNLAVYRSPTPDCAQVLSVERCQAYGPWARNYMLSHQKEASMTSSPLLYMIDWLEGMWARSFFAVDGPRTDFQTRGPFPVPAFTAVCLVVIGAILTLLRWSRIRRYDMSVLQLFAITIGLYVTALWLTNYQDFRQTGAPVAINGRYLVPLLLPMMLFLAVGFTTILPSRVKVIMAVSVICLLAWGGGALTYILRSNPAWYWPHQTVVNVNQTVQRTLGPWVPGNDQPTKYIP